MDKAYKLLLDQEQKKRALDVIQAGKEYVEHTVSIYSAAVFTGSISKSWTPCRRVNVNIAMPTGVIVTAYVFSATLLGGRNCVCLKLYSAP